MTKVIRLTVLIVLSVSVLTLAVANRHDVVLYLDPLSPRAYAAAIEGPLFLVILLSAAAGVLLGAFSMWLSQSRWRRSARMRAQEAARLKRAVTLLEVELAEAKKAQAPRPSSYFGLRQGLSPSS
ncbi:MAG: LapA family protein [Hyphomicrobiales bacterium]|nr:LapA family protein [Hyphomicrobiales bacterium]